MFNKFELVIVDSTKPILHGHFSKFNSPFNILISYLNNYNTE